MGQNKQPTIVNQPPLTPCIRFVERHKPISDEYTIDFIINKVVAPKKRPLSDIEFTHVMRNIPTHSLREYFHKQAMVWNLSLGGYEPKLSNYAIIQVTRTSPLLASIAHDFDGDGYFLYSEDKLDNPYSPDPTKTYCDRINPEELSEIICGHRGQRLPFGTCCICQDDFSAGWKYLVHNTIYPICHNCKLKCKGSSGFIHFICTPMK